jgi:hypothetical protein
VQRPHVEKAHMTSLVTKRGLLRQSSKLGVHPCISILRFRRALSLGICSIFQSQCLHSVPKTKQNMVVKIRLSRFGKRHQPIYNIVVSQARYVSSSFDPRANFFRVCPAGSSLLTTRPPTEQHATQSQWKSSAPTIPFPASRSPQTHQTPSTRSQVYRGRRRGIKTSNSTQVGRNTGWALGRNRVSRFGGY